MKGMRSVKGRRVQLSVGLGVVSLAAFFLCAPFAHASTTITTCTQLQAIGATTTEPSSGSYVLGNNIDCSASATWNPISGGGYFGFLPLANFTGTFNGSGHTISGLYINSATSSDVGLFSQVTGSGLVENVGLSGGSIIGNSNVGGLIGNMQNTASLQNASSTASVSATGTAVGGLVGSGSDNTTITNATSSAAIVFNSRSYGAGGIVGYYRGDVTNAHSSGTISVTANGANSIGGIAGYNEAVATIASSTSSTVITGSVDMYDVGGIAGTNYLNIIGSTFTGSINTTGNALAVGGIVGLDNSTFGVQNSYYNIDTVSIMGGNIPTSHGIYTAQYTTWVSGLYTPLNFSTYFPTTDGSGYYDLATVNDVKNLLAFSDANLLTKKFLITAPLTLPSGFIMPAINALEFNGGNQAISGLSISAPSWGSLGFFGTIGSGVTVKNMNLTGVSLSGQTTAGLAIINNGSIQNSSVTGTMSGNFQEGGLVSYNYGAIATSTASTTITGIVVNDNDDPGTLGGLVGLNAGTIVGSSAAGSITANQNAAEYIGGLVGSNQGIVSASHASVSISVLGIVPTDLGGLLGYSDQPTSNSYATGAINTSSGNLGAFIGGLIGYADTGATITNSYATGAVKGNAQTGGLAGSASSNITNSYALGNVIGTGHIPNAIGGFVGYNNTTIQNAFSTGSVSIDGSDDTVALQIGGFVGYNGSNIRDSYSLGNVTSTRTSDDLGGFVGDNAQNIFNDYSVGTVVDTADNHTSAGFVGANESGAEVFSSAWYTGANAGAIGVDDGFAGYGTLLSTNGHGTDVATMSDFYVASQAAYTTGGFPWDFTNTWTAHVATYPTLQAFPSYSPVTLSAVTPIPSQVTGSTAAYTFAFANPGSRPGSFNISPCNTTVQISTSTNQVTLSGLTSGQTYSCNFVYHMTDDGTNSNALFIGPFTVMAAPTSQTLSVGGGVSGQSIRTLVAPQLQLQKGATSSVAVASTSTIPMHDLKLGTHGADVTALQNLLIKFGKGSAAIALKLSGASGYFGKLTKAALIEFQKSVGISPASGYFGSLTRAYIASH